MRTHGLRVLLLGMLGALTLAPTPGQTGGCGAGDAPADFASSCSEWRAWDCVRSQARGDISGDEALQGCVDDQDMRCREIGDWPLDCQPFPTDRDVQNCIEELQQVENVDVPFSEISACDFCP